MKPKPPFQLVLLDDDGREMMTTYIVMREPRAIIVDGAINLNSPAGIDELRERTNKAIHSDVSQAPDWIAI